MIRQLKIRATQKDVKMKEEVVKESALDRLLKARGKTRAEFEAEKNRVEEALNEDTAGEKFLDKEPETAYGETITDLLDKCARNAEIFYEDIELEIEMEVEKGRDLDDVLAEIRSRKRTNTFNPLFIGPTGAGKTSIISQWAYKNGYELVSLNMMGDALDFLGVKTIDKEHNIILDDEGHTAKVSRAKTVATQAFDVFLRGKKKILFLDEINKTNETILKSLYDLISFHVIQNGDDVMELPKLKFVVGAMNPSEYGSGRERLDPALKARMIIYEVNYDIEKLRDFLVTQYDKEVEVREYKLKKLYERNAGEEEIQKALTIYAEKAGKKDLIEKLLENPKKIKFTGGAQIADGSDTDRIFVPRTLESAINSSDGTKNNFLQVASTICGALAADQMNNILANYKDKDHKANLIWAKDYNVKEDEEDKSFLDSENDIEVSDEDKEATELKQSALRRLKDARRNN